MNDEGQIKGIERDVPPAVSGEISAWEILNLRPVRGGWRPVGRKPVEITGITGVALHVQVMDTTRNLISIDNSTLYFKNLETGGTKEIAGIEGGLLDINSLASVLIVSTTARKYEFIYKWDSKEYVLFPDLRDIQLNIGIDSKLKTFEETGTALISAYKEWHLEERIAGRTEGFMILRYVVELTDGTYAWPSRPIEIALWNANTNDGSRRSTGTSWLTVKFPADLRAALQNHTDTIAGIAIFGTAPRSFYEDVEEQTYMKWSGNTPTNLIDKETFNLLQRFSTAEIVEAGDKVISVTPNYETLNTQEALIIEDDRMHDLTHKTSLVYNQRLLTGNITTKLYGGWNLETARPAPPAETNRDAVYFLFKIETSFGARWVEKSAATYYDPANLNSFRALRLISYPDIRAKKVYISDRGNFRGSFDLKPHPTQNFAYAFIKNYTIVEAAAYERDWETPAVSTRPDTGFTRNDVFTDPNRVQASEINNPFVMPYKNSYQVGNSSVLGFAVNGEPVSEGQFGQYPVYVFTGEGIYMMDVGVDPFISSVRQINGEICNSPKTIKNIGIGVLFTAGKGLMVINSLQVNTLSANFEQEAHNDYAVRHNELYKKAIGLTDLGKPDRFVSTVPFVEYLVGSNIGYDYPNREIWINNPDYAYSYVFSIDYRAWSKRDETFTTIVDDYPRYYVQQGNRCKNLLSKENTKNINIFLLSNPIKIRLDEFKQFRRIVARGEFTVERMGLYLFGSIDGFSWAYTGGKEIVSNQPTVPEQFEQILESGAFQSSFTGPDDKMYFIGASGTGNIYRLDDDGEIRIVFGAAPGTGDDNNVLSIYDQIISDGVYTYLMVDAKGVAKIDSSGTVSYAYAESNTLFNNAVMSPDINRIFFPLLMSIHGSGGLLISDNAGNVTLSANYTGISLGAAFVWGNKVYFAGGILRRADGDNIVSTGINMAVASRAEGSDGKLYLIPDGWNDTAMYSLDTNGNVVQIDFGINHLVRNMILLSSIDGKLFFRIMHADAGEPILYSIYRIDESSNFVHVIDKNLSYGAKGQDGKMYFYGYDGVYRFDDDGVLRVINSSQNFGSHFFFTGKLCFPKSADGKIWYLDEIDGDIKSIDVTPAQFSSQIEAGGRLYFLSDNGVYYLDDAWNVNTLTAPSGIPFSDVTELNGKTYFMTTGYGIYYLDGDEIKPSNITSGRFRFFDIDSDGNAYFAAYGTKSTTAYYSMRGILRIKSATTPIVKAKDAIYLGAHKSAKYAAALIEGVVTHEWNLTHISETIETVTNKKLR
jgi:hypothetical protein